jgi:hypothetical protein
MEVSLLRLWALLLSSSDGSKRWHEFNSIEIKSTPRVKVARPEKSPLFSNHHEYFYPLANRVFTT